MNWAPIITSWNRYKLLLLISLLAGCTAVAHKDPKDPYESFNRSMYKFNDKVDRHFMKPVAKGYHKVIPGPVNKGISNFFSNIQDLIVTANDILQGKFQQGLTDFARFLTNTTVGVAGFIDVASSGGMVKHEEDFGQTLGVWGFHTGPYLVLPFLGPSSVRDGVGLGVNAAAWPVTYLNNLWIQTGLSGVRTIDLRADLLQATDILQQAALDPYVYVREAYLQRRKFLVYDGKIPESEMSKEEEFEFDDEGAPEEPAEIPAPVPTEIPSKPLSSQK
ncbi:MlaA family lipoprotein [Candidatus Nitrosoglobus terrae]|nr:VacJ family lipoprotein [Candidatus Nitrosoglobus terrae]